MKKILCIAEIGLNSNGDVDIAKRLISISKLAGFDYVKFQKREPELAVPEEQKNVMRDTPWGRIKYIDYKKRIEFGKKEYDIIDEHCKNIGIKWFASVWDIPSVDFMKRYTSTGKLPSALITNTELLMYSRESFETLLISTGMSNDNEVATAIRNGDPDVIFHTNSAYPSPVEELNLNYMKYLMDQYPYKDIGYSSHTFGIVPVFASVALGAKWIECHVTLDRNMWGSDQMSSVEPTGMFKVIKATRDIEKAMGTYGPRQMLASELEKRKILRGN